MRYVPAFRLLVDLSQSKWINPKKKKFEDGNYSKCSIFYYYYFATLFTVTVIILTADVYYIFTFKMLFLTIQWNLQKKDTFGIATFVP